MKNLLVMGIVIAAVYFWGAGNEPGPTPQGTGNSSSSLRVAEKAPVSTPRQTDYSSDGSDQLIAAAFEQRRNQFQVQGGGEVIRVLSDDNDGSRHQRFIIRLTSGQTLLVAHNIDLAPRVSSIGVGDHVEFNGEYEWNAEGGVIHWTHHDPQGRHVAGWLMHQGRTYQ